MTSSPAAPESKMPEVERFTKLANATLFEVERAAMKGIAHPAAVLHQGKEYELAQALRESATALSLAQTEIKGHVRNESDLLNELALARADWACAQARIAELEEELLKARSALALAAEDDMGREELLRNAEKDAARYRWLRERSVTRSDSTIYVMHNLYANGLFLRSDYPSHDRLDAAIDEALKSRA